MPEYRHSSQTILPFDGFLSIQCSSEGLSTQQSILRTHRDGFQATGIATINSSAQQQNKERREKEKKKMEEGESNAKDHIALLIRDLV
jgi:hypothetical protein